MTKQLKLGDVSIDLNKFEALGLDITIPYTTNLGTVKNVIVSVSVDGFNIPATGTLNEAGLRALDTALTMAKAIQSAIALYWTTLDIQPKQGDYYRTINGQNRLNTEDLADLENHQPF